MSRACGGKVLMSAQPFIQPLESRQLFSAQLLPSVFLTSRGTLQIQGTAQAEQISIITAARSARKIDISITREGITTTTRVNRNDVKRVMIEAGGGRDKIQVVQELDIATTINGGAGADRIFATGAVINGGAGDDFIDATGSIADPSLQLATWVPVQAASSLSWSDQSLVVTPRNVSDPAWRLSTIGEPNPFVAVQGRASVLQGNDGNDTLIGSVQNDTISGGRGSDALYVQGDLNGEIDLAKPTGDDQLTSVERLRAFPARVSYVSFRDRLDSGNVIVSNFISS